MIFGVMDVCVLFEIWSMGSKPFENSSGAEVSG